MNIAIQQAITRSRKRRQIEAFRRNTTFELHLSPEQANQVKEALSRGEKSNFRY